MAKTGVLLSNIGSPKSYSVSDVKNYLNTFLMDPDIIKLPFVFRWPLVHGIIVPRRAPYSAGNYKKIWLEGEGSPLTVYTERFSKKLQEQLGTDYLVKIGMRYSDPSIDNALKDFKAAGVEKVLVVPLYPQYAEATTGSTVKEVQRVMKHLKLSFALEVLPPFFEDKAFIDPSVRMMNESLAGQAVDHYLFSFHGLPEEQIKQVEGCLVTPDCCVQKNACAKNCYRAQCFATAGTIAKRLGLQSSQWTLAFQSRLGRAEWLKPSTDSILEKLAKEGKKNIAVICPSFVADCLETLEEIGIGGKEQFQEHGGENYFLIPCLNADPEWTANFASLIKGSKTKEAELRSLS